MDEYWYQAWRGVGPINILRALNGSRASRSDQRCLFELGKLKNPKLTDVVISQEQINKFRRLLEQARRAIQLDNATLSNRLDVQDAIRREYLAKIEFALIDLDLLQAALEGNMKVFREKTLLRFGAPDKQIFDYTLSRIKLRIDEVLENNESIYKKKAAHALRSWLPEPSSTKTNRPWVAPDVFEEVRQNTLAQLGDISNHLSLNPVVKGPEIAMEFKKYLQRLEVRGWEVLTDKNITQITANFFERKLRVPYERSVGRKKLIGLMLHEIGTHILRHVNALDSDLFLLRIGFSNYLRGEEGIATVREQTITRDTDFAGEDRYLAIGLAWGCDGQPRDFRGVYSIMKRYYMFIHMEKGVGAGHDVEKLASDEAWQVCVRVFRGTDGKTSGACFTRDIIYREGNIAIWHLLEKNIEAMNYFDIGKYNPVDRTHVKLLQKLNLIPDSYQMPKLDGLFWESKES